MIKKIAIFLSLLFATQSNLAGACSALLLPAPGGATVGKNFDMQAGNGLIVVNKRNLLKTALSFGNPAQWTSKYGSVTFNWVSRELPQGGLNEAGLLVEVLWLSSAQFPKPPVPSPPTINELQWAQYQLDNYATVAEVAAHANVNALLIEQVSAPVHYFICDATSACMTMDPVAGQYVINQNLPYSVLTNSTYADSKASADKYIGSCSSVPDDYVSLDRFARITCEQQNSISAWSVLASVAGTPGQGGAGNGDQTQWSIVYDLTALKISVKTLAAAGVKSLALSDFDFSCKRPTLILDINSQSTGGVAALFSPYTDQADQDNLVLTQKAFPQLPAQAIPGIVALVGSSTCQEN